MDETMRLCLESPVRERIRREHRCPPTLDDPRLAEAQADLIEDRHYDQMVADHQHRPASGRDQQS